MPFAWKVLACGKLLSRKFWVFAPLPMTWVFLIPQLNCYHTFLDSDSQTYFQPSYSRTFLFNISLVQVMLSIFIFVILRFFVSLFFRILQTSISVEYFRPPALSRTQFLLTSFEILVWKQITKSVIT